MNHRTYAQILSIRLMTLVPRGRRAKQQRAFQALALIPLLSVSGCDPQTIYRTNQMSLDLNGCIQSEVCATSLSSRTTLGCYITRDLNDNGSIKRNRFSYTDQNLSFENDLLALDVGDRFIGTLFFLEGIETCDGLTPSSRCAEGCLLRVSHEEVTVGNRPTTVNFFSGESCDVDSSDEELFGLCFPTQDLDMGDMGGTEPDMSDMGGAEPDMGDMGGAEPDMGDMGGCDFTLVGTTCNAEGIGGCSQGIFECQNELLICTPISPQAETCDSIDNDCDGRTDEELGGEACLVGVGACQANGVFACVGGDFTCAAPQQPTPAQNDMTCNLIDDDCDGRVDEDYTPSAISCGIGACQAMGTLSCEGGIEINDCEPGMPGPSDLDLCDGVDSDCDGATDEAFVSRATSCGTGACLANGQLTCTNGEEVNSCISGVPPAGDIDQSCDLVDSDCDGRVDEAYLPTPTSCGIGVCASNGQLSCQGGMLRDTCVEAPVNDPNDLTCDGEDGDCDGRVDEGSTPQVSECGVGVCQRFGQISCISGNLEDSCQEGEITRRDDPTCNNLDEDCDGRVDEDFVPFASTCGEGVCRQAGQMTCVDGQMTNDCQEGQPQSVDDQSCDGIDQDCDGVSDENFLETQTSCGVGECSSTGVNRCIEGQEQDSCEPITFTGVTDDLCDGLDNDCDNLIDEDFTVEAVLCDVSTACVKTGFSTCIDQQAGDTCDDLRSGRDSDQDGTSDPCAWVSAPGLPFDILRHEVTFGAYRDCVAFGGCGLNPINYQVNNEGSDNGCAYLAETEVSSEIEELPLRCTNDTQLAEYCDWIGGRLPTKSELIDFALPIFGSSDCTNANGGDCPGATGTALPVCSLESTPGEFAICDLSGNVYETTSNTFINPNNNKTFTEVCFDDYIGTNSFFSSCPAQETRRLGIPRIGGRCVRD